MVTHRVPVRNELDPMPAIIRDRISNSKEPNVVTFGSLYSHLILLDLSYDSVVRSFSIAPSRTESSRAMQILTYGSQRSVSAKAAPGVMPTPAFSINISLKEMASEKLS